MARTVEKVRTLVDEDPAMADALETVLHQGENGELQWSDVKGDLTSGQWGRLIEKGILVDADEGFTLADPDAVRDVVEGDGEVSSPTDDVESSSWSKWDKLAALASVGLFAGYSIGSVREIIGGGMDLLLGPLDAVLPFYAVIMVLAVVTGLYSTLLQANLMDMEKMSAYQEQMKEIREREKAAKERGDDAELDRIREEQMEAMGDQAGMFKEQFRPMVWIMLLTIPVFLWMYWKLGADLIPQAELLVVMPLAGEVNLNDTVLIMPAWIVWYFLSSMSFTQVIRKSLNIQTTPT
ncbi:DUF106 domain-containing protein [Halobacteriaceae archaeon GCM10025711]